MSTKLDDGIEIDDCSRRFEGEVTMTIDAKELTALLKSLSHDERLGLYNEVVKKVEHPPLSLYDKIVGLILGGVGVAIMLFSTWLFLKYAGGL